MMERNDVVLLWLFLIPFILAGMALFCALALRLGGRVEVRVGRSEGVIFTGVGCLGWSRKFDPRQVEEVRIAETIRSSGGTRRCIELTFRDGRKPLKFGRMLWDDQRKFVAGALSLLLGRSGALA